MATGTLKNKKKILNSVLSYFRFTLILILCLFKHCLGMEDRHSGFHPHQRKWNADRDHGLFEKEWSSRRKDKFDRDKGRFYDEHTRRDEYKKERSERRRRKHENTRIESKKFLIQEDPYDVRSDFKGFIRKIKVDEFKIQNTLQQPVTLKVTFEYNNDLLRDEISLKSNQILLLNGSEKFLSKIRIKKRTLSNSKNIHLNPKFENSNLIIKVENSQDRQFLHQFHNFDFDCIKFTEEQLNSTNEQDFRESFNGCYEYMAYIAGEEGISLEYIFRQRVELYTTNNIGELLRGNARLIDSTNRRIPLVTHKIWVTSQSNPKDPSLQYIEWLENSIRYNKVKEGWAHYFWIQRPDYVSKKLYDFLKDHKKITLKIIDNRNFLTGNLYEHAIKQNKFGKASDIVRLELLRQYGGFYLDTDYELFQSLKPYSKAYDIIMGLEPMSVYLCNAFIGAKQNHPVINKSLEMIGRNLSNKAPQYIKNISSEDGFKTIIETGPALVTIAFALAAGRGNNIDIVLPPQTIYPAADNVYPKKEVVVPKGKIPAQAVGAHYWNTAWMDPKFGSQG